VAKTSGVSQKEQRGAGCAMKGVKKKRWRGVDDKGKKARKLLKGTGIGLDSRGYRKEPRQDINETKGGAALRKAELIIR